MAPPGGSRVRAQVAWFFVVGEANAMVANGRMPRMEAAGSDQGAGVAADVAVTGIHLTVHLPRSKRKEWRR